ncbi:MerR family transcriptional regulator [Occultella glacieicola]|uniref:MerR family transcriptional regulator n=1 Tax=Occultella glacieicola TaxID=2518684 RepID=A0ABY2E700_9MICO|nr:MerR family transcriptional regulator [Occultella glacieicola]TDE94086.1 MerR family transcriptional regulator [Occultella glacieicola]
MRTPQQPTPHGVGVGAPPADAEATQHIGAVAERTGLSLRTLRHYDDVGLLRPSARSEGGYRLYTDSDVERILLIKRMKPLGFTLDEMADLLDAVATLDIDAEDATARAKVADYTRSAEERRHKLARTLDMADEFIALLRAT